MRKLNLDQIKGGIQMPKELGGDYEKMITALKKVLYSEQFKDDLMDQFTNEPGDTSDRIAQAVMFAVATIINESKGQIRGELIVPCGIYMIADLADFVEQAGFGDVTDEDISNSMEKYIGLVMNFIKDLNGAAAKRTDQVPEGQEVNEQAGPEGQETNEPQGAAKPAGLLRGGM